MFFLGVGNVISGPVIIRIIARLIPVIGSGNMFGFLRFLNELRHGNGLENFASTLQIIITDRKQSCTKHMSACAQACVKVALCEAYLISWQQHVSLCCDVPLYMICYISVSLVCTATLAERKKPEFSHHNLFSTDSKQASLPNIFKHRGGTRQKTEETQF